MAHTARTVPADSRVVLVTGASSGIGEAVCLAAAARGDHVVLLARGRGALERVAEQCDRLRRGLDARHAGRHRRRRRGVRCRVGRRRAPRTAGRGGQLRRRRGLRLARRGPGRRVRRRDHHQRPRARQPRPPRAARAPPAGRREPGAGRLGDRPRRGAGHGGVRREQVGPARPGAPAARRQPRPARHPHRLRRAGGVDTPIYLQAATYGDAVGRPPFPVASPERIANRVLAVADHAWRGGQVGIANHVIRFGFRTVPWAYDRLVGPLFAVAAQDQVAPVVRGPGNVLASQQDGNRLRGDQGSALLGTFRNISALARRRVQRRALTRPVTSPWPDPPGSRRPRTPSPRPCPCRGRGRPRVSGRLAGSASRWVCGSAWVSGAVSSGVVMASPSWARGLSPSRTPRSQEKSPGAAYGLESMGTSRSRRGRLAATSTASSRGPGTPSRTPCEGFPGPRASAGAGGVQRRA